MIALVAGILRAIADGLESEGGRREPVVQPITVTIEALHVGTLGEVRQAIEREAKRDVRAWIRGRG